MVKLKPGWYKGHGRLGAALAALGRPAEAMKAAGAGLDLNPDSAVLQAEMARLIKEAEVRHHCFEPPLWEGGNPLD